MKDFLEKSYYWELERKDKLTAAAAFPIGFSAISFNLLYFLIKDSLSEGCSGSIIAIFSILTAAAIVVFIVNAFEFFVGFEYKYIGKAQSFVDWVRELNAHKSQFPGAGDPEEIFSGELSLSFARCADHNAENNDRKSTSLYWMTVFLGASLTFGLIGSAIKVLSDVDSSKAPQVMSMADSEGSKSPPPPPPPPPAPAERLIKESQIPPKTERR